MQKKKPTAHCRRVLILTKFFDIAVNDFYARESASL